MKLALPLGLLGLLAIIGLILIYILKPKYQDNKVSSTYIWKLSQKYVKRKVPLQWLKNSLLFIVQLLIFVIIAFMMTNPYVLLSTKQGEKIVILDASASMMTADGSSRFDRAKNEIAALAAATTQNDDKFTVILAADDASFVVRRTDSVGFVRQKLSETDCTLYEPNFSAAMRLAEEVLKENSNAEVHLYTDHNYVDSGRVTVHNMAGSEWNAAILNFTAARVNGKYVFTAEIASYGRAAEFSVGLNVNGKAQIPKLASCAKNGTVAVVWDNLNFTDYDSAVIRLQGVADAFTYDNEFHLFNSNAERFQVQLVSDDPGFLQRALAAVGTCDIVVPDLTVEDVEIANSGFDLYVYDGILPERKPTDGAVWLVNPPHDDVGASGKLKNEYGISFATNKRSGQFTLSSAGGVSDTYNTIMRGVAPSTILVTEYSQVDTYMGYESMMLCQDSPVLLAKDEDGLKTIVLAFDIHMSDITIRYSFPLMVANICRYTLTPTVEDTIYVVGDRVRVNAKPDTISMTVNAVYVDGTSSEIRLNSNSVDIDVSKPGTYKVTQVLGSGRVVTDNFYVRISENESTFGVVESTLDNPTVFPSVGEDPSVNSDTMDIFVYLAAAMLVIICIEWGLQYREQF